MLGSRKKMAATRPSFGSLAGLRHGDILTSVGGAALSGMRDMMARLGAEGVGTAVDVSFARAGR